MKAEEQTQITAFEFYENSDTANVYDVMEQYSELRIQQEREKWKEEVFNALNRGAYLAITNIDVVNTGIEPYFEDYFDKEVKPRINESN